MGWPTRPFLRGVNLPWIRYGGDFGANAWWPEGGVGTPPQRAVMNDVLARAADRGVEAVRWFALCDGRAGITVDPSRTPVGLDDQVRRDLDAALHALERHRVRALFVLFDFLLLRPRRIVSGVPMFGRRHWVGRRGVRAALLERVVAPLVRHAAGSEAVLGWEVMNEPEWVTFGVRGWRPWTCVRRSTMRAFLGSAVAAIRSAAPQPVSVGLASAEGLPLVAGLGLDLYQVHWYDHVGGPAALERPVRSFRLDAPVLLGEYPTLGSGLSPAEIVGAAERAGYAGAFAWSLQSEDAFSSADASLEAGARADRRQA